METNNNQKQKENKMKKMKTQFNELCARIYTHSNLSMTKAAEIIKNDEGAVATEYALVIGVIVVGIVGAASCTMDGPLREFFGSVIEKVQGMIG
jgi:Flp pilus assembly pilin Flp